MNEYRLGADLPSLARRYVGCMRAAWRARAVDPGTVLDAGLAICGAGLTALALWGPPALTGTTVAGPSWLLAVLPLIMGAPLVLRRRAPLLMWAAIWAGTLLQTLVTGSPPLGSS